jgi:hypothetical protein
MIDVFLQATLQDGDEKVIRTFVGHEMLVVRERQKVDYHHDTPNHNQDKDFAVRAWGRGW